MALLLGVVAWAGVGAIAGFVAPVLARNPHPRRLNSIVLGVGSAVLAGLAGYFVDSLFEDGGDNTSFFAASSPVLFVIVLVTLYMQEKRRQA